MARIFITGSSEGLGLMAGQLLAAQGHEVILHARNATRAHDARTALPDAAHVVIGDVATVAAMQDVAAQVNAIGRCDAVIHNVGLGLRETGRNETVDHVTRLWAVNVLTPYVLTALIERPARLVYLSSGMHLQGDASLDDLQWTKRRWSSGQAYSDTKLHDVLLAFGIARRWPNVFANAVNPGWIATKMGGAGAPDDPEEGRRTQAWLAVSDDAGARVTGKYLRERKAGRCLPAANDTALQERLLGYCAEVSGIALPA